jgi:4'-phosphopantetheinyl transferase
MPLFKTIKHNAYTTLYVWKITESVNELLAGLVLTQNSRSRLAGMKSEQHQKGFLAVRCLLLLANTSDQGLYYDAFGKPNLLDGRYVSISHSHDFSAIAVSNQIIGIDLELKRDKIIKIASKFIERNYIFPLAMKPHDYIKSLTVHWGIKESIFKIRNEPGISFKSHIIVKPFQPHDQITKAYLHFRDLVRAFEVHFLEVESYVLVYALEDNA